MATSKPMNVSTSVVATQNRRDYRLIFMSAYLICLAGAIFERLVPRRWRAPAGERAARRSVFGQARSSAQLAASAALMG